MKSIADEYKSKIHQRTKYSNYSASKSFQHKYKRIFSKNNGSKLSNRPSSVYSNWRMPVILLYRELQTN